MQCHLISETIPTTTQDPNKETLHWDHYNETVLSNTKKSVNAHGVQVVVWRGAIVWWLEHTRHVSTLWVPNTDRV